MVFEGGLGGKNLQKPQENLAFLVWKKPVVSKEREARLKNDHPECFATFSGEYVERTEKCGSSSPCYKPFGMELDRETLSTLRSLRSLRSLARCARPTRLKPRDCYAVSLQKHMLRATPLRNSIKLAWG